MIGTRMGEGGCVVLDLKRRRRHVLLSPAAAEQLAGALTGCAAVCEQAAELAPVVRPAGEPADRCVVMAFDGRVGVQLAEAATSLRLAPPAARDLAAKLRREARLAHRAAAAANN